MLVDNVQFMDIHYSLCPFRLQYDTPLKWNASGAADPSYLKSIPHFSSQAILFQEWSPIFQ